MLGTDDSCLSSPTGGLFGRVCATHLSFYVDLGIVIRHDGRPVGTSETDDDLRVATGKWS